MLSTSDHGHVDLDGSCSIADTSNPSSKYKYGFKILSSSFGPDSSSPTVNVMLIVSCDSQFTAESWIKDINDAIRKRMEARGMGFSYLY